MKTNTTTNTTETTATETVTNVTANNTIAEVIEFKTADRNFGRVLQVAKNKIKESKVYDSELSVIDNSLSLMENLEVMNNIPYGKSINFPIMCRQKTVLIQAIAWLNSFKFQEEILEIKNETNKQVLIVLFNQYNELVKLPREKTNRSTSLIITGIEETMRVILTNERLGL